MGGYLEAPTPQDHAQSPKRTKFDPIHLNSTQPCSKRNEIELETGTSRECYRLIHPTEINVAEAEDGEGQKKRKSNGAVASRRVPSAEAGGADASTGATPTLRLAEDSRFFYAHLRAGGKLRLHRTSTPLVSYRHRLGMSQSSSTPRKLLLRLRAKAWEDIVFHGGGNSAKWTEGFAIWGAGRDGKDFLKALSLEVAAKVLCFVDVDAKKIERVRWYDNPALGRRRIPILHFSVLSKSAACEPAHFGRIEKKTCGEHDFRVVPNPRLQTSERIVAPKSVKARKKHEANDSLDPEILRQLPVVVCVAMYRTNGALERNVASIGRTEGKDLWHIM